MNKRNISGLTLVELLITVTILGIIVSFAIPSYLQYVTQSRRGDAIATMHKAMAQQALFYANSGGTYTSIVGNLGFTAINGTTNTMASENGLYSIAFSQCSTGALTECVLLTATPTAGESQDGDSNCQTISLNSRGTEYAADGSSNNTTTTCWEK